MSQSTETRRELDLLEGFRRVRAATLALCEGLSPEDCVVQSQLVASPIKWNIAHTTWFFETFVLADEPGYRLFDERYGFLFNSYYDTVGERVGRGERGLLTRPALDEVLRYRRYVESELARRLEDGSLTARKREVVRLGLAHEEQHQELFLTDLKLHLSCNPLRPVYRGTAGGAPGGDATVEPLGFVRFDEGLHWIGADESAGSFTFDNEGPRHRAFVESFELATRPVTVGEYLEFMEDGGYDVPQLWLSDGWEHMRHEGWRAPLYWEREDGAWHAFTLGGPRPLDLSEPVCHVSYYEADAYATWAGARLPREAEWEVAASSEPLTGNLAESGVFHPRPTRTRGARPAALYGDVWEWTQSPYVAYPGFRVAAGALGEYNGKFMCNQLVLRGGSCATPRAGLRASYRNFFHPEARWQFSGLRLARD